MIITAQLFFNEIDLLELKCAELAGAVDAHVILESTTTFCGDPKPLWFEQNRDRFKGYPIIHRVLDDRAERFESPWDREFAQRQELLRIVQEMAPEIILWVDTDELPRADVVARFRESRLRMATIDMDHLLYFFDRVDPLNTPWRNGKIEWFMPGRTSIPNRVESAPSLTNAGWHFEFFGSVKTLMEKLSATSHAPEPGGVKMRAQITAGELPGLDRTQPYPMEKWPRTVQADRILFGHQILRAGKYANLPQ